MLGVTFRNQVQPAILGGLAGKCDAIESVIAEFAATVGSAVAQGAADQGVRAIAAAGDVTESLAGIVIWDPTDWTVAGAYANGDVLKVLRRGYVWVAAEDAGCAAGQSTFVRITADNDGPGGALRPVGGFRSDADAGEATECTRIRFRTSAAAIGDLVLVEIQLP